MLNHCVKTNFNLTKGNLHIIIKKTAIMSGQLTCSTHVIELFNKWFKECMKYWLAFFNPQAPKNDIFLQKSEKKQTKV